MLYIINVLVTGNKEKKVLIVFLYLKKNSGKNKFIISSQSVQPEKLHVITQISVNMRVSFLSTLIVL